MFRFETRGDILAKFVHMPRLSLNDDTNYLSEWYVKEGDSVQPGDKLFSIETDKSSMDVEAEMSGVVLARYFDEDDMVAVLSAVCAIGELGEEVPNPPAVAAEDTPQEQNTSSASAAINLNQDLYVVNMPRLSLNDNISVLSEWYVKEGDSVAEGDPLFSIETDKSAMDVEAESGGIVLCRYYEDGDMVDVLTPVCVIGPAGAEAPSLETVSGLRTSAKPETTMDQEPKEEPKEAIAVPAVEAMGHCAISPRARAAIRKLGIRNPERISPSGAEGRIMEEDVLQYMQSGGRRKTMDDCREVHFPRIRQVIADNMMQSLTNSAQLMMTAVFNATALQNRRAAFKREGGAAAGITIGDLIIFALAKTLAQFPEVNAWVLGNKTRQFDIVNIGVAVDTPRGLMVPTVMNADEKSLAEISQDVKALAAQCNNGKVSPDAMQNATFTVSNLGAFGIREFTPVINPPQAAILGVGTIDYAAKATAEGISFYPAGHLSLTIDHRALDGAPAARFMQQLCKNLEQIDHLIDPD